MPLVIRQAAIIEDLQQHVEHIRMGFLDLIQQHDRIGASPNGLGQFPAFFVTDITGRCPMSLLTLCRSINSLISMRTMAFSSSKRTSARALQSSVFPTPVGPKENERPNRPIRVLQPAATATHGVRDGLDRLILTDNSEMQSLFEFKKFFALGLDHTCDRDTRPRADNFGDFLLCDFLPQ